MKNLNRSLLALLFAVLALGVPGPQAQGQDNYKADGFYILTWISTSGSNVWTYDPAGSSGSWNRGDGIGGNWASPFNVAGLFTATFSSSPGDPSQTVDVQIPVNAMSLVFNGPAPLTLSSAANNGSITLNSSWASLTDALPIYEWPGAPGVGTNASVEMPAITASVGSSTVITTNVILAAQPYSAYTSDEASMLQIPSSNTNYQYINMSAVSPAATPYGSASLSLLGTVSEINGSKTLAIELPTVAEGTATLTLGGNNTFSGGVVVGVPEVNGVVSGTPVQSVTSGDGAGDFHNFTFSSNIHLNLNNNGALGTGTLTINGDTGGGAVLLGNSSTQAVTISNPIVFNNMPVGTTGNYVSLAPSPPYDVNSLGFDGLSNLTLTSTFTLTANRAIFVSSSPGELIFSGLINESGGSMSLYKNGQGTLGLTGTANSYTGVTQVNGGVLEVTHLANGGQVSSIGASSSAASNLILSADGTLRYIGSGDSTDRLLTLFPNGISLSSPVGSDTIESSGTGALNFTNTGALVYKNIIPLTRNFVLSGTNTDDNTFALQINDGVGMGGGVGVNEFTKSGVGTWFDTANNTYTGVTTVNDGRLVLTGTNTGTGTVILNGGVLEAVDGVGLTSHGALQFNGGIFQSHGTFARTLGTAADDVYWSSTGGGFAAAGGTLTVQLNGNTNTLAWDATNFLQDGQSLLFGSASADSLVDFQNGLDLGTGMVRTVMVNDNASSATDIARISGVVSSGSGGGLLKTGSGTLQLTGTNTYLGGTQISAGTLDAENNSALGTGAVQVSGGTLLIGQNIQVANTISASGGSLAQGVGAGTLFSTLHAVTSDFVGGKPTTAQWLGGQSSGSTQITETFGTTASVANDSLRISDVLSVSGLSLVNAGTGQTDVFVLQLKIDPGAMTSGASLNWLNSTTGTWVNAVQGNSGGVASLEVGAYDPLVDFQLGDYGVDLANGTAWAVLDHSGEFAITGVSAVPEAPIWLLPALTLAAVALYRGESVRRRRIA